jgi:hypothetical protein
MTSSIYDRNPYVPTPETHPGLRRPEDKYDYVDPADPANYAEGYGPPENPYGRADFDDSDSRATPLPTPPGAKGPTTTDPDTPGGVGSSGNLYEDTARALFPAAPLGFIRAFASEYAVYADQPNAVQLALVAVRDEPDYGIWFPGNLRDDGTVRVGEGDYWTVREDYESQVRKLGLDPSLFHDDQYVSLIVGDVSADEFGERVRTMAADTLARGAEFRGYFSELYGINGVSDRALLAWTFNNNIDALQRQIGQATVGFEGELRDFDVSLQLAASLYDAGIQNQGQATELFGQAAEAVPLFSRLTSRHFDPDDDFDLGEFIEAAVFDDQDEISRQRRLISQERALFSNYQPLRRRRETGAVVGLVAE